MNNVVLRRGMKFLDRHVAAIASWPRMEAT